MPRMRISVFHHMLNVIQYVKMVNMLTSFY